MNTSAGKTASCPICGKPASEKLTPFCSARCAQVDLNRWMGEVYRVPTNEQPDNAHRPESPTAPQD